MQPAWITLLSVLGGAIIAGVVGFLTQWYSAKGAREQAKANHDHDVRLAEMAREAQTRREARAERLAASQVFLQAATRAVDEVNALERTPSGRLPLAPAVTECAEASVAVLLLGPPEVRTSAEILVREVRKFSTGVYTEDGVNKARNEYLVVFRRALDDLGSSLSP